MLKIKGKALIEHLIERVKTAKLPNLVILCITTRPEDSIFTRIAKKCGVECFRGSEKDILDRYLNAALKYDVDFIVNVDGDDIFCDPELIDKTIEAFLKTGPSFIKWKDLPLGAAPCGIKFEALKKACEIKDESNTETGWSAYFTDTNLFDVEYLETEDKELKHPEIRMTLDYPEDLRFVEEIFNRLYSPEKVFTLREILDLLRKQPHLLEINKGVQDKYWKRFKQKARIKLKTKSTS